MTYHVQILLLVRQPLFDRAALLLTQTSWVLPLLSVGKMTLRLYGALNYSHGLSKGPSFGTGRGRIGPECVNLTVPSETSRRVGLEFVCIFGQAGGSGATLGARIRSRENELRILGLELGFVFLNEGADVICHLKQFLPLLLV